MLHAFAVASSSSSLSKLKQLHIGLCSNQLQFPRLHLKSFHSQSLAAAASSKNSTFHLPQKANCRNSNNDSRNGNGGIQETNHDCLVDFFDYILQRCTVENENHLKQVKQIHSQIMLRASSDSPFLASRLISVYSKFGLLSDARKVFESISKFNECRTFGNILLWNSILRANVMHGHYKEAIRLYLKMRKGGIWPDGFSFPLIIRASGNVAMRDCDYKRCLSVHCHVVQMGFQNHLHVVNELLGIYGRLKRMEVALKVFDRMLVRTQISWNTMLSGFANDFDCENAYKMFARMELEGWEPNSITWTSLLSSFCKCGRLGETLGLYRLMRKKNVEVTAEVLAVVLSVCADMKAFHTGEDLHGYVIKGGFGNCVFVRNSLICMYGKNGAMKEAADLFSGLESKSIVSWNTLISSYAESGLCDEAFAIFSVMEKLEDGYPMVRANVISWSAVICGFSAKERFEEALELFRQMQIAKVSANCVTIASVLTACAGLSALHLGNEIHAHVIRGLMDRNILVGNGLINMYAKCGSLIEGNLLFQGLDNKDLFSWNTMIAGYAMHGLGENALKIFDQMIRGGFKPDEVTFVSILSACSHAGLVAKGRKLFDQMVRDFNIEPQVEHYACMVDILGRAGLVHEAIDVVRNMPIEPNACVWGALLNSCKLHKRTDIAQEAAAQIFCLNSEMTGSYMLLSNLYAANRRWEDSAKVRHLAKTRGIKKSAGQSWIEVKRKVHKFLAGEALDTRMEEVYKVLNDISLQMETESKASRTGIASAYALEEEPVSGAVHN